MNREQLLTRRARLHKMANKYMDAGLIFMASKVRVEMSQIDSLLSEKDAIIEVVSSKVLSN